MHGTFRATETTGLKRQRGKEIVLRPLHPNAGLTAAYRVKIDKLIQQMDASVQYWVLTRYKNNEPLAATMAMDDIPVNELVRTIKALARRWLKQFDVAAEELAEYFAKSVNKRTDAALKKILHDGGFTVKFTMTRGMRDVFNATRAQNVALIKSIPEKYLKNVEGAVMRSVQAGRDMGQLAKYLEKNFTVTRKRAAFIARSQNNLATASMNRVRQLETLKITTAKWRHSGAGKHPRPTHVANNGKLYDIRKGWYDPHEKKWILPGELPNCRCVSISVIPGFS